MVSRVQDVLDLGITAALPVELKLDARKKIVDSVLSVLHENGYIIMRGSESPPLPIGQEPVLHARLQCTHAFGDGYGSSVRILADPLCERVHINTYNTNPGTGKPPSNDWITFLSHERETLLTAIGTAYDLSVSEQTRLRDEKRKKRWGR